MEVSSMRGLAFVVVEVGGSAGWHNAAQKYKVISKNLVATNFILSTTKFILEKWNKNYRNKCGG